MNRCPECPRHAEHARRDAIQAAVLLVSARWGDEAGEWLLAQLQGVPDDPR